MQIIAILIATIVPLLFLYLIYAMDLFKTGNFRYILVCFLAGAAAYFAAAQLNRAICLTWFAHCAEATPYGQMARNEVARYVAPASEEILKALILIYLVRKPNFTYFVDGAIYGFAAGIGFAVFENYEYILSNPGSGLGIAIGRVLSGNLMHAATSALVGVGLGMARFRRSLWPVMILVGGLLLGMLIHSTFNHISTNLYLGETLRLVYAMALGFAGAGLVAFFIQRGLTEEKKWIEEKLGLADRVTAQEASIVHRLNDLQEILGPLAQKFGDQKADQIENFLVIQARLGILRKTLDKLEDPKMRAGAEKQMEELRQQMDQARRAVGSYCMLYLRNIFPPDSSPLWGLLEERIKEKMSVRSPGGANVYASLGKRFGKPSGNGQTEN